MTVPEAEVTVLVQARDAEADGWPPFFTLLARHWPDRPWPVVLLTERLHWQPPGRDVHCLPAAPGTGPLPTWSAQLLTGLAALRSPFVLYLPADAFLQSPVASALLAPLLHELREDRADVIRLTEHPDGGPWHPTNDPLLLRVDQRARQRVSLQAALWRRDVLCASLRPHESAAQFARHGAARARRRLHERVLSLNPAHLPPPATGLLPYTPGALVDGRWAAFVPALFEREGLAVDCRLRGVHPAPADAGAAGAADAHRPASPSTAGTTTGHRPTARRHDGSTGPDADAPSASAHDPIRPPQPAPAPPPAPPLPLWTRWHNRLRSWL